MKSVTFQNDGLIDIEAVTTFGVNAKVTDNPFGYFGTGLKYAISVLLREGAKIDLYRGLEKFTFSSNDQVIRDRVFPIVMMNDQSLGFTLDLGKDWEMWQAYRELYCNTSDESGSVFASRKQPAENKTTIVIKSDEFYRVHSDRSSIIIEGEPDYHIAGVDIFDTPSDYLYFNGVRVFQLPSSSRMTYNLVRKIELTEDRTAKNIHDVHRIIRVGILTSKNKKLIDKFVTADHEFEQKIDFDWSSNNPSKEFMELISEKRYSELKNNSLVSWLKKNKVKASTPEPKKVTKTESAQLKKAVEFCHFLDYPVDDYPINVTDDLRDNQLGMARDGEIYISRRVFMQGTKQVAATLLEEYLHLRYHFHDETYRFQTYLFDVIMTIGERLKGEPL